MSQQQEDLSVNQQDEDRELLDAMRPYRGRANDLIDGPPTWKRIRIAKRTGTCAICGQPYVKGDETVLHDLRRNAHAGCVVPPMPSSAHLAGVTEDEWKARFVR